MRRLRFLKIVNVYLPKGLKNLSNELRFLDWHGYPLKCMPRMFQPEHLVELHMPSSCIEQLWDGTPALPNLRVLDLSHSRNLTNCPDFKEVANLEELNLKGCTSLVDIHPSVGRLTSLQFLNLRDCQNLTSLPNSICQLEALGTLILSECSKIMNVPEDFGKMKGLSKLYLDGIGITELPISIGHLTNLDTLYMKDCQNLTSLPHSICHLEALTHLSLSKCSNLTSIPKNFGNMKGLSKLYLGGIGIIELPVSVGHLTGLDTLDLEDCQNLASLPHSICHLEALTRLYLSNCSNLTSIPENFGNMKCLKQIYLGGTGIIELLVSVGHLSNLNALYLEDCQNLTSFPNIICQLEALTHLNLSKCSKLMSIPKNIGMMTRLLYLALDGTGITDIPALVGHLTNLNALYLSDCQKLTSLCNSICQLEALTHLSLSKCSKLMSIPENIGKMECLLYLSLGGTGITELPRSVGHLTNLQNLVLDDCQNLRSLPNSICQLKSLEMLCLSRCSKVMNIPEVFGKMKSLRSVYLNGTGITELPVSIVHLTNLIHIDLRDCRNLTGLQNSIAQLRVFETLIVRKYPTDRVDKIDTYHYPIYIVGIHNYLEIRLDGSCTTISDHTSINLVSITISDLIPRCLLEFKQLNILDELLDNQFQGNSSPTEEFTITIPGGEIPKWFSHKNDGGSSVFFQLPVDWCNSRFLGVAFCVVIELDPKFLSSSKILEQFLRNHDRCLVTEIVHIFYSHQQLQMGATKFKASFTAANCAGPKVKKCGLRLVYKEDSTALPKRRRPEQEVDPNSKRFRQSIESMDLDLNHEASPSGSCIFQEDSNWKRLGQSIAPMDLDFIDYEASPSGSAFFEEDPIDLELRL